MKKTPRPHGTIGLVPKLKDNQKRRVSIEQMVAWRNEGLTLREIALKSGGISIGRVSQYLSEAMSGEGWY
jgi:hypothetical protein